jgi:CRISPR-associated protein Csm1
MRIMNDDMQTRNEAQLKKLIGLWQGGRPESPSSYPSWIAEGLVLIGDFSGIQNFVFRPVPGAGGAARRLRARSFRVSAYTELAARWCATQLRANQPRVLFSGGGRFLINCTLPPDWETAVVKLQQEIDEWAWRTFEGELVFHLAAAKAEGYQIPWDGLYDALDRRRGHALQGALSGSSGWKSGRFVRQAQKDEGRCDGCGMTRPVQQTSEQENLCWQCREDAKIGSKLVDVRYCRIMTNESAELQVENLGMEICSRKEGAAQAWLDVEDVTNNAEFWPLLRHVPVHAGAVLDFDQIAKYSQGKEGWLGYLRIDVDRTGKAFADVRGDPLRTWALSRFLHLFFAAQANAILSSGYPHIYAVFGGGDDIFVVGPWNELLEFALTLRSGFRRLTNDAITFSAGISLAKPREHILTKAWEAGDELEFAKNKPAHGRHCGRDQIRVLGVTLGWNDFGRLLEQAKQVKGWLESGEIPSRFLHQVLELHHRWTQARLNSPDRETPNLMRYRPLLYYQAQRNLSPGAASNWAHSLLHRPSDWPQVDFIIRYAMLASKRDREES